MLSVLVTVIFFKFYLNTAKIGIEYNFHPGLELVFEFCFNSLTLWKVGSEFVFEGEKSSHLPPTLRKRQKSVVKIEDWNYFSSKNHCELQNFPFLKNFYSNLILDPLNVFFDIKEFCEPKHHCFCYCQIGFISISESNF